MGAGSVILGRVEDGGDRWAAWLLERRDAGNEAQRDLSLRQLESIRDRVLANAEPLSGATLLDVGAGDGLIGLGALDRVGPHGRVIFSDVSEALLRRCRSAVELRGECERAAFVETRAEELAGVPDRSVDVVTTRSVLIYVEDKSRAFASMHRVVRPGGRISLFEPINRLMWPEPAGRFWGYDLTPVSNLVAKVDDKFDELEGPEYEAAMLGFDDRDLARLAEEAGFERVHVECHLDIAPGGLDEHVSLEALLDGAPNPNAPTVREAVSAALTESEQERFLSELSRAFSAGRAISRKAIAFVVAVRANDGEAG